MQFKRKESLNEGTLHGSVTMGYRLLSRSCWSGRPQKPLNHTAIALVPSCLPELDGETLLLRTSHTYVVMRRRICLEQGWEFLPCWVFLGVVVVESSVQSAGVDKSSVFYPAGDPVCYNSHLPGKLSPLVQ